MDVYWRCLNRACGEAVPATAEDLERETRGCVCGSPMKKREQPEVFSYLNFLRNGEVPEAKEEPLEKERIP